MRPVVLARADGSPHAEIAGRKLRAHLVPVPWSVARCWPGSHRWPNVAFQAFDPRTQAPPRPSRRRVVCCRLGYRGSRRHEVAATHCARQSRSVEVKSSMPHTALFSRSPRVASLSAALCAAGLSNGKNRCDAVVSDRDRVVPDELSFFIKTEEEPDESPPA